MATGTILEGVVGEEERRAIGMVSPSALGGLDRLEAYYEMCSVGATIMDLRDTQEIEWARSLGYRPDDARIWTCGCEKQHPPESERGTGAWEQADVTLRPCEIHRNELGLPEQVSMVYSGKASHPLPRDYAVMLYKDGPPSFLRHVSTEKDGGFYRDEA